MDRIDDCHDAVGTRRLERVQLVNLGNMGSTGFINSTHIIRGFHFIPAFHYGCQIETGRPSIVRGPGGDWVYYYINRFVTWNFYQTHTKND